MLIITAAVMTTNTATTLNNSCIVFFIGLFFDSFLALNKLSKNFKFILP